MWQSHIVETINKRSEVIDEIKKLGRKAKAFKGDNSKGEIVKKIVEDVLNEFGRIDVLVNNAGIWTYGEIDKMDEKVWDETMDLNLKGTFLFCRYVVPIMKKQGDGRIVNLSSTAGQRGEASAFSLCSDERSNHFVDKKFIHRTRSLQYPCEQCRTQDGLTLI